MPPHKHVSREKYFLPSKTHVNSLPCRASFDKITKNLLLKMCKLILSSKIEIKRLSASVNDLGLHDHVRYINVKRSPWAAR